ncbi:unnamed protein product [Closterium sp. NIES-54]
MASGYTPWWMKKSGEGDAKSCPTVNRLLDLSQGRETPLPRWTKSDIEAFAKEDPVHGNQVRLTAGRKERDAFRSLLISRTYLYPALPLPPRAPSSIAPHAPSPFAQVLLSRQASLMAAGGAAVGGLALAAYSYRYSRSAGGAFLTLVVGAVTSWAVTEEAANIGLGLYKFSSMDANFKFIDWWAARHPEARAADVTTA